MQLLRRKHHRDCSTSSSSKTKEQQQRPRRTRSPLPAPLAAAAAAPRRRRILTVMLLFQLSTRNMAAASASSASSSFVRLLPFSRRTTASSSSIFPPSSCFLAAAAAATTTTTTRRCCRRGMVTLHGSTGLSTRSFRTTRGGSTATTAATTTPSSLFSERTHNALIGDEKPPDPASIGESQIQEAAERLADWLWNQRHGRINRGGGGGRGGVVCLTGAGISTESGIPDYRGVRGSYHAGHRPMRHDEFMAQHSNRQRYWGRSLVGWRYFDRRRPAAGHHALAALERSGHYLGVNLEDRPEFYADDGDGGDEFLLSSGRRSLSVISQNVDSLHRRAGTRHLVELHGRTDRLDCQHCGYTRSRRSFHEQLDVLNAEWLLQQEQLASSLRADGDADVAAQDFSSIQVPGCDRCGTGFFKPAVVFFGDSVPRHRVRLCEAAVAEATGLLVVGSSLAVHSAFRHVRAAAAAPQQTDICILNVGATRAEVEGLPGIVKLEAPAGPVLARAVQLLGDGQGETRTDDVVLAQEAEEQAASR